MRLTTRGKLAVTAITDLALHSHGRPVALPTISARQGISLSYLEDIFSALRRAGLIRSIRGPSGGYTLTRQPGALSVADIVLASDKYMPRTEESAADAPPSDCAEMTAELWASFHSHVLEYLQSITVADLLAQQKTNAPSARSSKASAPAAQPHAQRTVTKRLPHRGVPNSVFALGLTDQEAKLRPG